MSLPVRSFFLALVASAVVATGLATPAHAQRREDQNSAREEMRAGRQLPIEAIERRILPRMRDHEYLGPEYDPEAVVYRLKFIRDGRVTWIDVDARTAKILHVSR